MVMELLYAFILVTSLINPIRTINCKDNECTRRGEQHPLCLYPVPLPSPDCGTVLSTGFSHSELNEVINMHNNLRWHVAQGWEFAGNPGPQPPASNMQIMVWDDILAETAQRWVNQCNFAPASCVDMDNSKVGQINGKKTYNNEILINNVTASDIIELFYKQVKHMNRNHVLQLKNLDTKAYTQLVWAESNRLGCGRIVYQKNFNEYSYYMMCLYSPAGNNIGKPVYLT